MNRLLVLTTSADDSPPDSSLSVTRQSGVVDSYHYVDTVDQLAHYRHASVSEEEARELIA
jgi:hypothetical protein